MKKLKKVVTQEFGIIKCTESPGSYKSPILLEESVIMRFIGMLHKTNFYNIKDAFRQQLKGAENMEQYIALLEAELAFHKTVECFVEEQSSESECPEIHKI